MFFHVKELQFNARVSRPDPRFAGLLLEQLGGGNGKEVSSSVPKGENQWSAYPQKTLESLSRVR